MFSGFRRWISGPDLRSPAAVRGAQKLALIDRKVAHAKAALRGGERALAELVQQERAGLQQAEAMLLHMIAGQADVEHAAVLRAQAAVAGTAGQIEVISGLVAQTRARLVTLKEAAIAGRAFRLEHIGHCGAIDQALISDGPEAADRLLAQLPRDRVQTKCRALLGGAAKLHFQMG